MATPTVAANAYANLARILDTGGAGKGAETERTVLQRRAQGRDRQRHGRGP